MSYEAKLININERTPDLNQEFLSIQIIINNLELDLQLH